jgi:hypothetical protein
MYTTARMDYAKSSRPNAASQIVHQGIRGQHVISAVSEENINIVLLQSCGNDLCLLLSFTFFFLVFFRILLVYLYDNEILSRDQNKKCILCFMNSTSIIGLFYNSLTLSIMC